MTWTKGETDKIDGLVERVGEMSERFAVVADHVERHDATLYEPSTGVTPRLATVHTRQNDCLARQGSRFTAILKIIGLTLVLLGILTGILLHFYPRPATHASKPSITKAP